MKRYEQYSREPAKRARYWEAESRRADERNEWLEWHSRVLEQEFGKLCKVCWCILGGWLITIAAWVLSK